MNASQSIFPLRDLIGTALLALGLLVGGAGRADAAMTEVDPAGGFTIMPNEPAPAPHADEVLLDAGTLAEFGFLSPGTSTSIAADPHAGETATVLASGLLSTIVTAGSYTISVGGALTGGPGFYGVFVADTPLPASVALLGTAVAGLGAFKLRRLSRKPA